LPAGFDKLGGFQKEKEAEMLEGIPLQRFGTKWDIAMACIYLAGLPTLSVPVISPLFLCFVCC